MVMIQIQIYFNFKIFSGKKNYFPGISVIKTWTDKISLIGCGTCQIGCWHLWEKVCERNKLLIH